MNLKANLLFICLAVLSARAAVLAQSQAVQDDEDVQSWNDLQLTVPLTKQFDFVSSTTARLGKNVSRLNEGRYQIGFIWKANNALSVNPFFIYIGARNSAGHFRIEQRLNVRAAYKFPIKSFGLIHRSAFEYRIRGVGNTWRYRPSLTFDKNIPQKLIPNAKFFVTEEPFYDSATSKFSRNRLNGRHHKNAVQSSVARPLFHAAERWVFASGRSECHRNVLEGKTLAPGRTGNEISEIFLYLHYPSIAYLGRWLPSERTEQRERRDDDYRLRLFHYERGVGKGHLPRV